MATEPRVRALVVEDEPWARAGLRALLDEVEWLAVAGEAASGTAAVAAIDSLRPELVFLDVEMPGCSGIEVLRRATHRPHVVFTTAFAEHAVAAFELGAIDYLLKPFAADRLAVALERVRAALGEPAGAALDRLGEALAQGPMTRLFVRSGRRVVPLPVADIVRFEAIGDYVAAHAGGTTHVLHVPLARLEQRLDPARFVRIHRGHLVNLDQVVAFRQRLDGRVEAELRDGSRLPVSRDRARSLRHFLR
ncbi:MAG TPA: LytTR family DNA-binding domain-containing protein [Xanthomonadales bacterium]|nr:LytTR family DNA-binding domain-containing protein [Xanthomonadales bacterium]